MKANVHLTSSRANKLSSTEIIRFYYVYVLICSDGKPYTGCTNDLKDRLNRHKKGYVFATKNRLPIQLRAYFAFDEEITAFAFEKYLKSGSGRAFLQRHLF